MSMNAGEIHSLLAYEQARQASNAPMMIATDALKRLFSNDMAPLSMLRSFGLNVANRIEPLKACRGPAVYAADSV
jgi:2-polyprenyl-6-methoxyphenol hydroxylase-like FAD-dependent oxidoreductase